MARELIDRFKDKAVPVLTYQGMSGVASATAVMLAIYRLAPTFPFIMVYVRKDNEESHGSRIEWEKINVSPLPWVGVFVDDFVSSGATMRRCMVQLPVTYDCNYDEIMPTPVDWRDEHAMIVEVKGKRVKPMSGSLGWSEM